MALLGAFVGVECRSGEQNQTNGGGMCKLPQSPGTLEVQPAPHRPLLETDRKTNYEGVEWGLYHRSILI